MTPDSGLSGTSQLARLLRITCRVLEEDTARMREDLAQIRDLVTDANQSLASCGGGHRGALLSTSIWTLSTFECPGGRHDEREPAQVREASPRDRRAHCRVVTRFGVNSFKYAVDAP